MDEHLDRAKLATRWNLVLAVLLFIAPFVFQFTSTTPSSMDDYAVGIAVFIIALIRQFAIAQTEWLSWVNGILALWLIVSPFVLRITDTAAMGTDILLGIIIGALAITSITETRKYAHAHAR